MTRDPLHHIKARAAERYGLSLTSAQCRELADACRDERSTVVVRRPRLLNPTTTLLVRFSGVVVPIVYDQRSHMVVTILPPDYRLRGGPQNDSDKRKSQRRARQRRRVLRRNIMCPDPT